MKPGKLSEVPAWGKVIDFRAPYLQLRQPAWLDFGAAGKGHLVDIVGTILEAGGIGNYCVDAGGDMRFRNSAGDTVPVGLEHPDDPTLAIGLVRLGNRSLCGSSGNRRAWAGFHHIIDPAELRSPDHIRALWVVADSTLLADGLATALFFAPADKLAETFDFEFAIINEDLHLERSPQFPAEIFTN